MSVSLTCTKNGTCVLGPDPKKVLLDPLPKPNGKSLILNYVAILGDFNELYFFELVLEHSSD